MDLNPLITMAKQAVAAIERRSDELANIEDELERLSGTTCNGREYWRDGNKLYILHSIDQSCPLHGSPIPGGRLRTYIGCDNAKIREAQNAIALETKRLTLESQARTLQSNLGYARAHLHHFYHGLGYTVDQDGNPNVATADDVAASRSR